MFEDDYHDLIDAALLCELLIELLAFAGGLD